MGHDDLETDVIHTGDAFDVLPELPDESIHAVVTDPPYGLAFMGRDWDDFSPREYQEWCEEWAREVKRVLKPGGHLLAFSGNRTHHRLFTGVEDAGYEIRDTLTWHYGSGFPKASDVSKTIDKRSDAEREVVGKNPHYSENRDHDGFTESKTYVATGSESDRHENKSVVTAPATDAAKEWDGWKTGLKPATEFVVMARKPYDGATVDSVLENGTGALNIDACRVDTNESWEGTENPDADSGVALEGSVSGELNEQTSGSHAEGRYPANVVFDETAADALDAEVGETSSGTGGVDHADTLRHKYGEFNGEGETTPSYEDAGGPSRYYYTSKASRSERTENGAIENDHPTVKPRDLMEWLVKLVTREEQVVLDPFIGSGTTALAAKELNRRFVGIERQAKYADVARVRCGLTPEDPSVVRDDDAQSGVEEWT